MLACEKGHKWNTTFDTRHPDLKPGDKCPLEIGWDRNKKIKLCGCILSEVNYERGKDRKIKPVFKKRGRRPKPYNRSKSKREGGNR